MFYSIPCIYVYNYVPYYGYSAAYSFDGTPNCFYVNALFFVINFCVVSVYIILYHITVLRPLILLMVPRIASVNTLFFVVNILYRLFCVQ